MMTDSEEGTPQLLQRDQKIPDCQQVTLWIAVGSPAYVVSGGSGTAGSALKDENEARGRAL